MTTMTEEWLDLTDASDQIAPSTRSAIAGTLSRFERFLRERVGPSYRKSKTTIEDFRAYKRDMLKRGLAGSYVGTEMNFVATYYAMLADEYPGKYEVFLAKLRAQKRPKDRGSHVAYPPYPLKILPDILEAAREVEGGGLLAEAYPITALFFYTGMRAQGIGLKVDDPKVGDKIDFEEGLIHTKVKGGFPVKIPMHKRLAEILKEHLETRTYKSEMLFLRGKYPYKYLEGHGGEGVWDSDHKAEVCNRTNVIRVLRRVEEKLRERGIDERLTSHRFRVSVRTYASQYGYLTNPPMDLMDGRNLLTHGARDITDFYDKRDPRATGAKWEQLDFSIRDFVESLLSPGGPSMVVSSPNGNGDVVATLQALRLELVKTLDPGKRAIIEPLFEGFEKSLTAILNGAA